jgi:hypothetical protein
LRSKPNARFVPAIRLPAGGEDHGIHRISQKRGGAGKIEARMIGMDSNKHEQQDFLDFWNGAGAEAKVTEL